MFGLLSCRLLRTAVLPVLAVLLSACSSLPAQTVRVPSTALPQETPSALRDVAQRLHRASASAHQSAFLLVDSADDAYASRLALVRRATRTLDVQYYAIHNDAGTRVLLDEIQQAAQRGVRVRVLLDDFNSKGADAQVLRLAFVPHIEMRLFNPVSGARALGALRTVAALADLRRIQHRMHNKQLIADNQIAIVGGRNLGEAYFGQADEDNFIDMDVLVLGRLVAEMSGSFDAYWNHPLAYPVQSLLTRRALDAMRGPRQPLPTPAQHDVPAALDIEGAPWVWAPGALLADAPAKLDAENRASAQTTVVGGLLDLMGTAQRQVIIVSPYFVPGHQMMRVMAALRQRGVQVQLLTNSLASSDAPLAHIGYARHRKALLQLGVEIYEMRAQQPLRLRKIFSRSQHASRASLHAKLVVVDAQILGIGSMNLDLRSQLQNSEVAVLLRSQPFASQVIERVHSISEHGAWRLQCDAQGQLLWHPPAPDDEPDTAAPTFEPTRRTEPDASIPLRLLLHLAAPFAPDEML